MTKRIIICSLSFSFMLFGCTEPAGNSEFDAVVDLNSLDANDAAIIDTEYDNVVSYNKGKSADVSLQNANVSVSIRIDEEGKATGLFLMKLNIETPFVLRDIGLTGTWDVRHLPEEMLTYIWFQEEWLGVDHLPSVQDGVILAQQGDNKYVFQEGDWRLQN